MKGLPLFFLGGDGTTAADDSGCLSGGGHGLRGRPLRFGRVGDGVAGGGVNTIEGDVDKAERVLFLLGGDKDDGDIAEGMDLGGRPGPGLRLGCAAAAGEEEVDEDKLKFEVTAEGSSTEDEAK